MFLLSLSSHSLSLGPSRDGRATGGIVMNHLGPTWPALEPLGCFEDHDGIAMQQVQEVRRQLMISIGNAAASRPRRAMRSVGKHTRLRRA